MAHTLTTTSTDQLDDLLATAVGRFGRPARIIDWSDPEGQPARILTVARIRDRVNGNGYRIADAAVAAAIVDRVCDIGLIPRLR